MYKYIAPFFVDSVLAAFGGLFLCLKIIITSYGIISEHKNIDLVIVIFYAVSPSRGSEAGFLHLDNCFGLILA